MPDFMNAFVTDMRLIAPHVLGHQDKAFAQKMLHHMADRIGAKARGAGAGAMAGTLTSVALNWNEPDSVYRNYVDLCLKERGHKVLGWR